MAIDANKLIYQYLTVNPSGLYTLVADRVAALKKCEDWTETQKCVVFSIRGGDTDPHTSLKRLSMQFLCFGGSTAVQDAMDVARAIEDRLHGVNMQTVSEGVLVAAQQETEAQAIVDDDTKEVYVYTTYEIECRAA